MVLFQQYLVFAVSAIFKLRNNSVNVKSHDKVLLILFTVSLRPHIYFYQLEFDEFAAGLIEVFSNHFGKWVS